MSRREIVGSDTLSDTDVQESTSIIQFVESSDANESSKLFENPCKVMRSFTDVPVAALPPPWAN